jgi:hypothetical protein
MVSNLPPPAVDRNYRLEAEFAVDTIGNWELVNWTRPNDPAYATRVLGVLQRHQFFPARDHAGVPTCGRTTVRPLLFR